MKCPNCKKQMKETGTIDYVNYHWGTEGDVFQFECEDEKCSIEGLSIYIRK
jgi:hypothetical protein